MQTTETVEGCQQSNVSDLLKRREKCFSDLREIEKSLTKKNRAEFMREFDTRFVSKKDISKTETKE